MQPQAAACYDVALHLAALEKRTKALPYAQRALKGRMKLLGKEHPDTRKSQELVQLLTNPNAKTLGAGHASAFCQRRRDDETPRTVSGKHALLFSIMK